MKDRCIGAIILEENLFHSIPIFLCSVSPLVNWWCGFLTLLVSINRVRCTTLYLFIWFIAYTLPRALNSSVRFKLILQRKKEETISQIYGMSCWEGKDDTSEHPFTLQICASSSMKNKKELCAHITFLKSCQSIFI